MKGKIITAMTIVLCCCSSVLHAQYEQMLKPQKDKEIARIKQLHMHRCDIYMVYNGTESPYGAMLYDTGGRVLKMNTQPARESYVYDNKGRLTSWVDSAYDGRRFMKSQYSFSYNADGKLASVTLPAYSAKLNYDGAKKQLVEDISGPAQNGRKVYSYNEEGKLNSIEMRSAEGVLMMKKKLLYNKYGDLASEIEVIYHSDNTRDSNTAIYTYDNSGRLLRKQTSQSTVSEGTETADESAAVPEPSTAPTVKTRTDIYNYTYDRMGNMATETLTSSDPKMNGKKEWVYDNNDLLQKYTRYDGTGKVAETYTYRFR